MLISKTLCDDVWTDIVNGYFIGAYLLQKKPKGAHYGILDRIFIRVNARYSGFRFELSRFEHDRTRVHFHIDIRGFCKSIKSFKREKKYVFPTDC